MRPRADTRQCGPLQVQAVYSVRVLADAANVTHQLLLRLLRGADVELLRSGRCVLVPLAEIEAKVPTLLKSIEAAERLRNRPT